ncbi:uncharacterized protein ARB_08014 [Trichophyton benhamiae CBS 112371]|uniref:Uncharacterized protein n=1 Tax=Arthroderma benhamiae (strain ATCC MYA-4681 / CBS 112371) TaxID=663331 RepID=D4AUU7_ARTBC|nr:uncharacterized protein ARB_08014 [Trichophyton benhamiae CBS 112371]EFE33262.1 hypothetical protein ARB_08014 [Trichophyton benhamiae CBS 112371]
MYLLTLSLAIPLSLAMYFLVCRQLKQTFHGAPKLRPATFRPAKPTKNNQASQQQQEEEPETPPARRRRQRQQTPTARRAAPAESEKDSLPNKGPAKLSGPLSLAA